MKQIIAIIRPYVAEKVLEALSSVPVESCDICEVKGYGRQKNYLDQYADGEYSAAFLPKVEIVVWVEDDVVDEVVSMLVEICRTGRMGDGKIFVLPASCPL